jgi:hypothetical protein
MAKGDELRTFNLFCEGGAHFLPLVVVGVLSLDALMSLTNVNNLAPYITVSETSWADGLPDTSIPSAQTMQEVASFPPLPFPPMP